MTYRWKQLEKFKQKIFVTKFKNLAYFILLLKILSEILFMILSETRNIDFQNLFCVEKYANNHYIIFEFERFSCIFLELYMIIYIRYFHAIDILIIIYFYSKFQLAFFS